MSTAGVLDRDLIEKIRRQRAEAKKREKPPKKPPPKGPDFKRLLIVCILQVWTGIPISWAFDAYTHREDDPITLVVIIPVSYLLYLFYNVMYGWWEEEKELRKK